MTFLILAEAAPKAGISGWDVVQSTLHYCLNAIFPLVAGWAIEHIRQRNIRQAEIDKARCGTLKDVNDAENAFTESERNQSALLANLVQGLTNDTSAEKLCELRERAASNLEEKVLPLFRQYAKIKVAQTTMSPRDVDEFVIERIIPDLLNYGEQLRTLNLPKLCELVGRHTPVSVNRMALYEFEHLEPRMSKGKRESHGQRLKDALQAIQTAHEPLTHVSG